MDIAIHAQEVLELKRRLNELMSKHRAKVCMPSALMEQNWHWFRGAFLFILI